MWDYYDNREEKEIQDIEYVKNLYNLQAAKTKNEKYIEELLLRDYVRTIKKHTSRYDYITLYRDAQKELKEKSKKKCQNLETLKHFIMEDFLNNDDNFKLTNIMEYGLNGYAWNFEFEGYGVKFEITIPMVNKLTTENISYAGEGKFAFALRKEEHVLSVLKTSYKIEDIAEFIKEYFKLDKMNEDEC